MDHGEAKTPTKDLLAKFIENLQQPNARLCVSTPNNLGSEDVHYTSRDVFPLIVTAVNAHEATQRTLSHAINDLALAEERVRSLHSGIAHDIGLVIESLEALARAET